jgi:hypothetical protein
METSFREEKEREETVWHEDDVLPADDWNAGVDLGREHQMAPGWPVERIHQKEEDT